MIITNGNYTSFVDDLDQAELRSLMGGKGLSLLNMTNAGLPVPNWLNLSTDHCTDNPLDTSVFLDVLDRLRNDVQTEGGRQFANPDNPLLVSVRSGAPVSMPGMMETILNVGLNDEAVATLAQQTNPDFAWDCYRRLIAQYVTIVQDNHDPMIAESLRQARTYVGRDQLPVEVSSALVRLYLDTFEFPQDPKVQLGEAINAVFRSWNGPKAVSYREIEGIDANMGTAVNVQEMVFGNYDTESATGVYFTRNPNTGENEPYGEFLWNAQGEDVVSGEYNTLDICDLPGDHADALRTYGETLETMYANAMDIEFTIESGKLYILQARAIKPTARAGLKITMDLLDEGLIDSDVAAERIEGYTQKVTDEPEAKILDGTDLGVGIACSPGRITGRVARSVADIDSIHEEGDYAIFVAQLTTPEDIVPMSKAEGILTLTGGPTCHAAVTARGWNKPCVVGIDPNGSAATSLVRMLGETIKVGTLISIDGGTGTVRVH